jgi:glycosyltransferase involved in cell wall biosynthesis
VAGTTSISVVICGFTEDRLDQLLEGVRSVAAQTPPAAETIVVIDQNDALRQRVAESVPQGVDVLENEGPRGLSDARNTGLRHAHGDLVAFLDDDARAEPGWLEAISEAHADPGVVGVGGWVEPRWLEGPVAWMPPEFYWVFGCSYRGLPTVAAPIRNPIGANMAFRREALDVVGGFSTGTGRIGTKPLGHEETDLAVRIARRYPGSTILQLPNARVQHAVPRQRLTWRYFVSRCWAEGVTKAVFTDSVGSEPLATEYSYALRVLPRGVARGMLDAIRGDRSGLGRAAAIVAGLFFTATGYLWGKLRRGAPAG